MSFCPTARILTIFLDLSVDPGEIIGDWLFISRGISRDGVRNIFFIDIPWLTRPSYRSCLTLDKLTHSSRSQNVG